MFCQVGQQPELLFGLKIVAMPSRQGQQAAILAPAGSI